MQTPSPMLLRTDCEVTYVGQVCKFSFFSTSKWNTSIGKSLKIEKYMIYNKEILWRTNSQKKKEKNPHKLSKYRSNCQNMVQKAWNTWVSRRYIFFYTFWNDSSPLWVLKRHFSWFFYDINNRSNNVLLLFLYLIRIGRVPELPDPGKPSTRITQTVGGA